MGVELSGLRRAQLERLDRFPEVLEMYDRLVAAPVVTRDEALAASIGRGIEIIKQPEPRPPGMTGEA